MRAYVTARETCASSVPPSWRRLWLLRRGNQNIYLRKMRMEQI